MQRTIALHERGNATLIKAGIAVPRIGVCGINPHAGGNGLFGYGEEEEKVVPAVKILQNQGLDITGPLPADTLLFRAGRGRFRFGGGDVPRSRPRSGKSLGSGGGRERDGWSGGHSHIG